MALRQHDAVAVGHHAAVGNDRHDGNAITFGERLIMTMLEQLEVNKTAEETAERDDHHRTRDQQPPAEMQQLALRVPELRAADRARTITVGKESAHRSCPIFPPRAAAVAAPAARPL